MTKTAIIILAAGNSSRFGSTKQLLQFNNKKLLQHVIDEAIESGAEPVVVVTGGHANEVSNQIVKQQAQVVLNNNWHEGIASSIVAGVHAVITCNNSIENIIIAVCDQPFISSSLFKQLYQIHKEDTKHIVASAYADTIGTPVLFTQKYFDALLALTGDEGAKKILQKNNEDVTIVDFPQGAIDIDTQEDYEDLLDKHKRIL